MQVSDAGTMITRDAGVVQAFALWLILIAPQWIMLLWGVSSIDRIRAAAARSFATKFLVAGAWMAALALAMIGSVLVTGDVLGPERLAVQHLILNLTLAQEGFLVVVGFLLVLRRQRRATNTPTVAEPPSPKRIGRMLVGWIAAAVLLIGLAAGPFYGRPGAGFVWGSLALAGIAIVGLIVMLSLARRRERNEAAGTRPRDRS